jgi:short subunit dehydrogenase-like uncharacterized protein
MKDRLLVYGATGFTGKLIARSARDQGVPTVLSGRNPEKLRAVSSEVDLDFRVAQLHEPESLDRSLEHVGVVVNTAAPFSLSAPLLIEACLRNGVHYLDVTGEVPVIDKASTYGAEAQQKGIMVMPAVGFDVVPSDCLAAHVLSRSRSPRRLSIGISGLELLTRGSARTIIDQIGAPVWIRREGRLLQVQAGSLEHSFDYGDGPRTSTAVSWADVASAYFTTAVPDITVYFEATPAIRAHDALLKLYGWAIPLTPWRELLKATTRWMPEGPTASQRAKHHAVIVAEMEDADGTVVRARMRTPEAYSTTAFTASTIAKRALGGDVELGFQTPARVYGADFPLSLPGVWREDL